MAVLEGFLHFFWRKTCYGHSSVVSLCLAGHVHWFFKSYFSPVGAAKHVQGWPQTHLTGCSHQEQVDRELSKVTAHQPSETTSGFTHTQN